MRHVLRIFDPRGPVLQLILSAKRTIHERVVLFAWFSKKRTIQDPGPPYPLADLPLHLSNGALAGMAWQPCTREGREIEENIFGDH